MAHSGVGTTWWRRLVCEVGHTRIPGQIAIPRSRTPVLLLAAPLIVPKRQPGPVVVLFAVLLVLACGGRGKEGPPALVVPDSARVIFAGRPIDLPSLPCVSAILIEPGTNQILYEQNARARRAPASIAKMTLELVVMNEIAAERLSLDDTVRVSPWASKIGGSQVYLADGEAFPLGEMMQAIVIHSANDACVAVAEHIAGNSDGFVRLMNQEVEALELTDTHYVNVHGLDDEPGEGNYTTAYDISQIGRKLIQYPHILDWSSTIEAPFRGGNFLLQNTNKLLGHFAGLDGLKTGYTRKAGFCLCATAERKGLRLISVILGANSLQDRIEETASLLAAGFQTFAPVRICGKGDVLGDPVRVRGAKVKTVRAVAPGEVTVVVSRPDDRRITKVLVPIEILRAPVRAGTQVGTLRVLAGEAVLAEVPAVAAEEIPAAGWLRRLFSRD
jgi:D-alanyl-D-alanine carboxypeptidase (penicillin-binding protein 5/6)